MKIILKQDFALLGDEGQIVEVKNGYARNFLIPQGIAISADESNLKSFEEIKRQKGRKMQKVIEGAEKLASELSTQVFTISVKAGEDKIFGSVTSQMVYDTLADKGFVSIEKKKIIIKEPIKTLGEHEIEIKLQPSVIAKVKVNVIKFSDSITNHSEEKEAEKIEMKV